MLPDTDDAVVGTVDKSAVCYFYAPGDEMV